MGLLLAGCGGEPSSRPAPEATAPESESVPLGGPELGGLEPWSDAWILAHAPGYLEEGEAGTRRRREAMEASLTRRENLYARTRLGAYGRGRAGWDALPEWNPPSAPIDAAMAAAFEAGEAPPLPEGARPLWDGARPTTWEGWRALGERVFFLLPLRSEPFWEVALRDPARGEALGVERTPDGSVPGLVRMRDIDGRAAVGITCALCHAARGPEDGQPGPRAIVAGRARRRLDYGAIRVAYSEAHGRPIDPAVRARWERWGPGRADVIEDVADVPIAITDLFGLRHERLLTQAGTLTHRSPLALAIRQETQYIQANHHHTRPPRALMFALAVYLYSLEPPPRIPLRSPREDEAAVLARGAEVFGAQCARCHGNAAGAGDEITPIGRVETDPELATGNARGTGGYRPSPLIRVLDAAPYLHHGAVPSLAALLSPERLEPGYRGSPAGPGPVLGHGFGMFLPEADKAALLAHLREL